MTFAPPAIQMGGMGVLSQNLAIRIAAEATIIHPKDGRIRFRPYDYQRDLWMDQSRFRVVLKARQIGMSQAVAAEALYKAMLTPNRTILFVSRSLEAAKNLLGQARAIYEMLRTPASKCTRDLQQEMHFANGSRLVSVAAQRNTGRGYPASDIYLDECAFMQYADEIYQAIGPTVAQGGTMTVLSTPNGQQGLFFDIWQGKYGNWSKHKIPFWRCPRYDEAWYRDEVSHKTTSQFATEFECSFESSGDPVFRAEEVGFCAEGWRGLLPHGYPGRLYITAWDIARKRDFTVGTTIDATDPVHQVVHFRRERGWPLPDQQALIADTWQRFPGLHIVEGNNQGDMVLDAIPGLAGQYVYREMHLTQLLNAGIPVPMGTIVPFQTQTRSKENIITALQFAVEAHRYKHGIPEHREEMLKYQRNDKNLVQDTIMSAAIAEWASQNVPITETMAMGERVDASGWDR